MENTIHIKGEKPLKITSTATSPCSVGCPLGTNVKAYVSLIAAGRFAEALAVVRQTNPFPGICGRVCPHPCEDQCHRGEIDDPVSIVALKRFVADYELRRGVMPQYDRVSKKREKIAVIGSGPAGLTCAADLAREGYSVRVFEALSVPGGMMAVGIPPYRLPRDILHTEIAAIEALGVDIQLNARIGDHPAFDDVVRTFDAVFIATGAQKIPNLGIPGERDVHHGLVNWMPLLRDAVLGHGEKPGDHLVIIGGGNTAVDSARVALRLGTKDVHIIYRRSREEMPAYKEEVADAEEEGIGIHFLAAPVRLLVEEGQLTGVECIRMRLGKKDNSGRRRPFPVKNSEFVIPCDSIIPAIGQEFDGSFLSAKHSLRISDRNLLMVDPGSMATHQKGVFAGGDATTGPATVVEAIAAGHRGAQSIVRSLNDLPLRTSPAGVRPHVRELESEIAPPAKRFREKHSRLSAKVRRHTFDEIEQGLTEAQAVTEAQRCMRCGLCLECPECLGVCDGRQVILEPPGLEAIRLLREAGILIRVPPDIHRNVAAESVVPARYRAKEYEVSVFTATIDEHLCRGCGLCEEICAYRAVRVVYRGDGVFTAEVNHEMCRGGGTCVAACPSGAIDQNHFTAERIDRLINAGLHRSRRRLPVVIFACRWNGWLKSISTGPPVEMIRVMCMGRLVAGDVLKAFEKGAAGVLMVGCSDDTCHYGFGSRGAHENLQRAADVLSLLGIARERFRVMQAPTENAPNLCDVVKDFRTRIEGLGTLEKEI